SQDQPAREEIGLKRIEPDEENHHHPAGACGYCQPGSPAGRLIVRVFDAARRDVISLEFSLSAAGSPAGAGRLRVFYLWPRSTEQVPERPSERAQQADEGPEAAGGPYFEEHIMGIEDLFAGLGKLVLQVGTREIAGADAPPKRRLRERTCERLGAFGDH